METQVKANNKRNGQALHPTMIELSEQAVPQDTPEQCPADDDDNVTVIVLDPNDEDNAQSITLDWIEQQGPELEERRRNILLRELRNTQRQSCFHFGILCLVPNILLFVVLGTVVGQNESCDSDFASCRLESRSFINAFTTRCLCDPIAIDPSSLINSGP